MPKPGDSERIRRANEVRVWWVEFNAPVERMYCTTAQLALVTLVDMGITWAGLETHYHPRQHVTDREGVWLIEWGIPIVRMAVEEQHMRGWMELVRSNGIHGKYREAGTERVYEF